MQITVFTIVYNDYGRFIKQWNDWLNKQTIEIDKLVVLGTNHNADIDYLKENKIDYVLCDSNNMGKLRNIGLEQIKTNWWLYFSVDDELLPTACEEIINTDADAVSLTFDVIEPNLQLRKECHSPCINTVEELNNWQRCWGGYVAIKGNTDIRFNEHIEVPNLTLHFELFKRGIKTVRSNGTSAIHHRWEDSHHFRSKNIRKSFVDEIENAKNEILQELIEGAKEMKIEALQNYKDIELKKEIKVGDQYIVDKKRGKVITEALYKNKPIAKIIEIIKEEVKEKIEKPIEDKEVDKMLEETKKKPKTNTKKKVAKK